jgi:hypothetical protein
MGRTVDLLDLSGGGGFGAVGTRAEQFLQVLRGEDVVLDLSADELCAWLAPARGTNGHGT